MYASIGIYHYTESKHSINELYLSMGMSLYELITNLALLTPCIQKWDSARDGGQSLAVGALLGISAVLTDSAAGFTQGIWEQIGVEHR